VRGERNALAIVDCHVIGLFFCVTGSLRAEAPSHNTGSTPLTQWLGCGGRFEFGL